MATSHQQSAPVERPRSERADRRRLVSPRVLPYLLVAPAVIYLLGITLYPFIYAVRTSLYEVSMGMQFWVGWDNYARLLTDWTFWSSLLNTGLLAGVALSIETVIAMGLALLVYRDPWIRGWRFLFLLPMLFMPSAVAFMWKLLFFPGTSVVNDLLIRVGLIDGQLNWLGSTTLARASIVIADVWQWTPFLFVIFIAGLQGMDEEIEEAANLDGARWYHTFWLITLPMMRPVIAIALTLRGIDLVIMFTKISLMTNGGPAGYTETVSYFIYRIGFKQFSQGYASAASVVVLILTVAIAMFVIKRFFRTATV